jgi:hypothetical protein
LQIWGKERGVPDAEKGGKIKEKMAKILGGLNVRHS